MVRPQNNQGFSLASVMVGVAIVGIVAVGTLSLFENMTKSQNMADFRTQRDVLVEEIRAHLSDTQACRATFGSISLLTNGYSETISQIRNADNSVKWETATPYSNNTYRISGLVFNYTPGTSPTNPSTATANLMVQLQAMKKVAGVNVSDPKFINISIKRNSTTGAMLECIASAKMSDGIWQRTATVNDIFYTGGNVGVGSASPATTLDVDGGVRAGDESRVTQCDSSLEGVLRYNKSTHRMEFCDGTQFRNIGSVCRKVSDSGPAPSYVSRASCAPDEVMTGGGGICEAPGYGLCSGISRGTPTFFGPDSTLPNTFTVDCWNPATSTEACSIAYAICCK
ncbi:MAG: prepilin-type N-terminal cleavage/methylation domain-containing protein [Bdellovibrionales bacterium]|nr:prepilin-type N-terminal cleavage/methylation domain-containing protein [Bdellovibrionales bacterium]